MRVPELLVHKLHARTAVGGGPAAFARHSHVLTQLIALCIIIQSGQRAFCSYTESRERLKRN